MSRINSVLDSVIVELKKNKSFDGVRFKREFNSGTSELPVQDYLAIVSVDEATLKNNIWAVNAVIRVYSPVGGNGKGLTERVGLIAAELKKIKKNALIKDLKIKPIAYDSGLDTVYRSVNIELEFFESKGDQLPSNVSNVSVLINGKKAEGISSVSVVELNKNILIEEFLSGNPFDTILNREYEIKLKLADENINISRLAPGFAMILESDSHVTEYRRCTVEKYSESHNTDGAEFEIKLKAKERYVIV